MRQWCRLNCTTIVTAEFWMEAFNAEFCWASQGTARSCEARQLSHRRVAGAVECCAERNKDGGDNFFHPASRC